MKLKTFLPRVSFGRLFGRKALAGFLSVMAVGMLAGAAWLAGYPFYTDLRAAQEQKRLAASFETTSVKHSYQERSFTEGSALTRMVIPKLSLDTVVVEGVSLKALAAGAGHYPRTPLPGELGNVGIAGHRTMNGKPLSNLQELTTGDRIILITPLAQFTYEVIPAFGGHANPWVVHPNDASVLQPTDEPMLTLTTCHPRGSAKQRMVVRAKLVGMESVA